MFEVLASDRLGSVIQQVSKVLRRETARHLSSQVHHVGVKNQGAPDPDAVQRMQEEIKKLHLEIEKRDAIAGEMETLKQELQRANKTAINGYLVEGKKAHDVAKGVTSNMQVLAQNESETVRQRILEIASIAQRVQREIREYM